MILILYHKENLLNLVELQSKPWYTYHMLTLKLRIKDKHCKVLNEMARSVNFVWNYCNELTYRSAREKMKYLSAYNIAPYSLENNGNRIPSVFVSLKNSQIKSSSVI